MKTSLIVFDPFSPEVSELLMTVRLRPRMHANTQEACLFWMMLQVLELLFSSLTKKKNTE